MQQQERRRFPWRRFVATAEVRGVDGVRSALVRDLSPEGAYLGMADPFSKGTLVRIEIYTNGEFFQADATVMHSMHGLGMGVMFNEVSPRFQIVLQRWLLEAQREVTWQP